MLFKLKTPPEQKYSLNTKNSDSYNHMKNSKLQIKRRFKESAFSRKRFFKKLFS